MFCQTKNAEVQANGDISSKFPIYTIKSRTKHEINVTYSTDLTSDCAGLFRDRWNLAKVKYQAKSNLNRDYNQI